MKLNYLYSLLAAAFPGVFPTIFDQLVDFFSRVILLNTFPYLDTPYERMPK